MRLDAIVEVEKRAGAYRFTKEIVGVMFSAAGYRLKVEGELPVEGPRVLLPVHQNSLDGIALIRAIDEPLVFVYNGSMDIPPVTRMLKKLGSISANERHIEWKRLYKRLDEGSIIVNFPQAGLQPGSVRSHRHSIVHLIERYSRTTGKGVLAIPVGIEQCYPLGLSAEIPTPVFHFPLPGTRVVLRFGQPMPVTSYQPHKLVSIAMREAARLSSIPYDAQPT